MRMKTLLRIVCVWTLLLVLSATALCLTVSAKDENGVHWSFANDDYTTYKHYEYEDAYDLYEEEAVTGSFWVFFVLVGFLVPVAPLVIGLIFANSRSMSHPKRWYLLAGLATLWMVAAALLTFVLLI